jgi:hypothetical protein
VPFGSSILRRAVKARLVPSDVILATVEFFDETSLMNGSEDRTSTYVTQQHGDVVIVDTFCWLVRVAESVEVIVE